MLVMHILSSHLHGVSWFSCVYVSLILLFAMYLRCVCLMKTPEQILHVTIAAFSYYNL